MDRTMENSREDQFIRRYVECQSGLYRFIATLVPNPVDAEELFQEASLTAWRLRERFDPSREMSPWLCGIARKLVAAHYRTQKTAAMVLEPDVLEALAQYQTDEDDLLRERANALNHCLEKLPNRQKELIHQFYHSRQTIQAFGKAQGLSPDALYKMMQRIRMALFQCINDSLRQGGIL